MKNRRNFLKATAASVAGMSIPTLLTAGTARRIASPARRAVSLANLHAEDFERLLYSEFRIRLTHGRQQPVLLAAVTPGAQQVGIESFSVVFAGSAQTPLPQGTYVFEHPALGSLPLFVVPRVPHGLVQSYEAVFNRLV